MPACGIACDGPMARDENDCPLCACDDDFRPHAPLIAAAIAWPTWVPSVYVVSCGGTPIELGNSEVSATHTLSR